ncbi:tetratricopeptide repeat protein [Arsenicibacter rosenii]|uniref:ABC transporter substrate-binding protein n=1 Tax=Arsenicibacter rosenii TaxID=1750698 RepID=A0A1S2VLP4_9BACT|nr:tetratricopeptide repeat protein [Arsenicibacter rosenii]OIN58718.1 hypothetical protein BLX24_14265 [Arsenicibacter rosenii]
MKRFFLFLLFLFPVLSYGQITTDTYLQQTIQKTLDNIYSYDFAEADLYMKQLRARYPNHPIGPILQATKLQWQYMPLKDNPVYAGQFTQSCNQALASAQKMLEKDSDDPEGVFFALTAHSYLALKLYNEGETMKAVNEAKKAYGYMRQGFRLMEKNPEFYFTTGLYNYYVERFPMDHPIVKPVMLFFQDGDTALGLRQMDVASKRAIFTRIETCFYLSHIYLEHESQFAKAAVYAKQLAEKHPQNALFVIRYTESLILAGRYDEAAQWLDRLKGLHHKFVPMPVKVLEAMLFEKEERKDAEAAALYQAALKMPYYDNYTKEYYAFANAGLARIAARASDRSKARAFYKKALDYAEYKSTIREAKGFIKE